METSLQLDCVNGQNLLIMQAYAVRAKTKKATEEAFDGWLERLDDAEGVTKEELTTAHGQLIALGFLKFEIAGRAGLRYQISPRGKTVLENALAKAAQSKESDDPESFEQFQELEEAADAA